LESRENYGDKSILSLDDVPIIDDKFFNENSKSTDYLETL
jgi:hypothetical protein